MRIFDVVDRFILPNALYRIERAEGTADPYFCAFDDGVDRLVKWHRTTEPFHGAKSCFNDLVVLRLGQLIGAPVLRGSVIYVPDTVAAPEQAGGLHFGLPRMVGRDVRKIAGTEHADVQHFLPGIENLEQLPASAALLSWLRVQDRSSAGEHPLLSCYRL
jgi:hypothetical protein